MAARNTRMSRIKNQFPMGVAASTSIFVGTLVMRNGDGDAVPGQVFGSDPLDALRCMGIASGTYLGHPGQDAVNTSGQLIPGTNDAAGAARAISVEIKTGLALLDINATSIDETTVGELVYAASDRAVDASDGGSARPVVGRVVGLEDGQVWVNLEDQAD